MDHVNPFFWPFLPFYTYANHQYTQTGPDKCQCSIRGIICYQICTLNGPNLPIFTFPPHFLPAMQPNILLLHFCPCQLVQNNSQNKSQKRVFSLKMTFLAFLGQKITKMAKKPFFYFEKWKLFWHTLIIWEDQHFSCFTLLIQSKSRQKCDIFSIFGPKNHKKGQKTIFSFEKWKFFLAHLNHLGRPTFFM